MVVEPNATADPRTVVVHLHDADATHAAVVTPRGLDLLALVAVAEHHQVRDGLLLLEVAEVLSQGTFDS